MSIPNTRRFKITSPDGTGFRVSTLGNYFPSYNAKRETLGSGVDDYFETMVFATTAEPSDASEGCGCRAVESYVDLYCARYPDAGAAQRGHEDTVTRYIEEARQ